MKHFVIQLQVAFGVVYVGDTMDDEENDRLESLMLAIFRTVRCALCGGHQSSTNISQLKERCIPFQVALMF